MKKWVVRFLSLLVFNVVVLLVIGWLTPARVGWAAIWGGVILTAATIWIRPLIHSAFAKMSAKSAATRTSLGEKLVQGVIVFIVALIVWLLVVFLSRVSVGGWFWGYVLPPVILLIGWGIYATVDDKLEGHAGALYDKATGRKATDAGASSAGASSAGAFPATPATRSAAAAKTELHDGLTEEQRRMLDELGKG